MLNHFSDPDEPWAGRSLEERWVDGDCSFSLLWLYALGGNAEAPAVLLRASGGVGGPLVQDAFYASMPNPAFRELVTEAWRRHSRSVLEAAACEGTLLSWFARAAFDLSGLPESIELYRGVKLAPDVPWQEAGRGYSWTADLGVAASFAIEGVPWTTRDCTVPVVVRATVPPRFVRAYFMNGRRRDTVPDPFAEHVVVASMNELLACGLAPVAHDEIETAHRRRGVPVCFR